LFSFVVVMLGKKSLSEDLWPFFMCLSFKKMHYDIRHHASCDEFLIVSH
jgi:hypothetical protein